MTKLPVSITSPVLMNFWEKKYQDIKFRAIKKLKPRSILNIWIPSCDQKYTTDIFSFLLFFSNYDFQVGTVVLHILFIYVGFNIAFNAG